MARLTVSQGGGCTPAPAAYRGEDPASGAWVEDLSTYPLSTWVQLAQAAPSVASISIPADPCDVLTASGTIVYPAIRFYLSAGTQVGVTGKYRIDGGPWVTSGNPTLYWSGPSDITIPLKPDAWELTVGTSPHTVEAAVDAFLFSIGGATNFLIAASTTQIQGVTVG